MFRVLTITHNPDRASYRLRVEALRAGLQRKGIALDVHVRPANPLTRRRLLRSARDYDAVLLHRKLLGPADARLLRRSARRVIVDIDDALMFHNHRVDPISSWRTWRRFTATARNVDLVVAGNEYLAGLFRDQGAKTTVLATMLDPGHYRIKEHANTDGPTLVWIGSKSTLPYLQSALPALARAAKLAPGLRILTIADATVHGAGLPVEHAPWSVEGEAELLCRGDIGIAPTPRDRWTMGKCGFKILQYMAAGLPVIATPTGANAELVAPGRSGFLADDAEAWVKAAVELAGDVGKRAAMGRAGRARVEEEFCVERAVEVWTNLLVACPAGSVDARVTTQGLTA